MLYCALALLVRPASIKAMGWDATLTPYTGPTETIESAQTWLSHIGKVVRDSEGQEITLWVRRNRVEHLRLTLVPRQWAGRGLVG